MKNKEVVEPKSSLDEASKVNAIDDDAAIRNQLPFESFVIQPDLKFFNRVALQCICKEYIKRDEQDWFFAGVSPCGDKALLHVNLAMFKEHSVIEQMGVLAHEFCHVVLAHLVGSRKGDPKVRNIAEDLLINEYIQWFYKGKVSLPKRNGEVIGLTMKDFCATKFKDTVYDETHGMPIIKRKGQDWKITELNSDEIYKWLEDDGVGQGKCNGDCANCKLEDAPAGHTGPTVDCNKGGKGKGQKKKGGGSLDDLDRKRIDNHQGGMTKDNMSGKLQKVMDDLLKAAEDGHFGDTAGQFAKAIRHIYKKHFPFKDVLDKIFNKEKLDFNRGNRRLNSLFPDSFFPRRRSEEFKTYGLIDMSGSCEFHAPDFLGYIAALPSFEEVYCIDTVIHHVIKKGDKLPKMVYGCGGTDLNPALKVMQDIEKKNPNIKNNFIILTDGEIPEVEYGPRNSMVIVFTTHQEVHFKKAMRKWMNIDISEKLEHGVEDND